MNNQTLRRQAARNAAFMLAATAAIERAIEAGCSKPVDIAVFIKCDCFGSPSAPGPFKLAARKGGQL